MTPDQETPDPDDLPADADLGLPVAELSTVAWSVSDEFVTRIRGRIERRALAAESIELLWTAPLQMLLEFLRWPFDLMNRR